MANVKRVERPLSPHLQIYRPQLTSIVSILTRITGNALIVGVMLAVWWLLAAATSAEYFATAGRLGRCGIIIWPGCGIFTWMRARGWIFPPQKNWAGASSSGRSF